MTILVKRLLSFLARYYRLKKNIEYDVCNPQYVGLYISYKIKDPEKSITLSRFESRFLSMEVFERLKEIDVKIEDYFIMKEFYRVNAVFKVVFYLDSSQRPPFFATNRDFRCMGYIPEYMSYIDSPVEYERKVLADLDRNKDLSDKFASSKTLDYWKIDRPKDPTIDKKVKELRDLYWARLLKKSKDSND